MSKLFEPTQLKQLTLQNRVAMAPMTRARTSQPGNIPNQMMATYYKQRATAGLIISEYHPDFRRFAGLLIHTRRLH